MRGRGRSSAAKARPAFIAWSRRRSATRRANCGCWPGSSCRPRRRPPLPKTMPRLAGVLAERATDSRSFFGRVAGEWDHLRRDLFGEKFTAMAMLALVDPEWIIADIGCGTGNVAEQLSPHVKKVIAIDREPAMLESARKRLKCATNIEFRLGDLDDLPLKDGEVDAAIVALVLHHLADPGEAVQAVVRGLRCGGTLLIVDMVSHDRASYRHTMGHVHLGFDEKDVRAWAKAAGLKLMRHQRLRADTDSSGPGTFVAALRKA